MNIEMKYHNVYYYCGILNNVIEYQQEEFLTKLWEFSYVYLEKVPEKYDKESVLLLFCRWAVKSIMEEDMEEELAELKQLIEESADKNEKALEKVFWNNGVYFSFEVERAIEHYYGKSNHFYEWLLEETYDLLEDAFDDYLVQLWIGDKYENVVDKIAEEMFYILFMNRDFLLYFNHYMSRTHEVNFSRIHMPEWVKRAVFYRDRGRCVLCGKDLSGQLAISGEREIHYDHMVSLEQGGMNDVTNIQLLCSSCNLSKGTFSAASNIYQNWYDMNKG